MYMLQNKTITNPIIKGGVPSVVTIITALATNSIMSSLQCAYKYIFAISTLNFVECLKENFKDSTNTIITR